MMHMKDVQMLSQRASEGQLPSVMLQLLHGFIHLNAPLLGLVSLQVIKTASEGLLADSPAFSRYECK